MKYIFVTILFLVTSCAGITTADVLYKKYSEYNFEANEESIHKVYFKYFSTKLLNGKDIDSLEVTQQLLFKNYMISLHSHYEKIDSDRGCLTVNGYDKENIPLSFNIEYFYNSGDWLMDDINVLFLNKSEEFGSVARCPNEYIN